MEENHSSTFDDIDLKIIQVALKNGSFITSWQIASLIFQKQFKTDPYVSKVHHNTSCRIKSIFIRKRLERLTKYGICRKKSASKKSLYKIEKNNVFIGKRSFPDGKRNCIGIKTYGKWVIIQE